MSNLLRSLALAILGAAAFSFCAGAQTPAPKPPAPIPHPPDNPAPPAYAANQAVSNPVCVRLEAQLAVLDRGASDPARLELIRHAEDAVAKQQADLDRSIEKSRRMGCEIGFFTLFTGRAPQCQPVSTQIQQMRDNLDRMMSELERLKSDNNYDREGQRRALIGQLAQSNCGPQYRAAAAAAGPAGFFDALFGGGTVVNRGGDGAPAGTYRTLCVRSCDGYYFPISYSTVPNRFADDQRACQRECPATQVQLFTYRNPGEDITQAVSLGGQRYTELPNAFLYRKEFTAACSCRRPGQTWADALKNADDATTLATGDIVVTDQNAKALSQPPQQRGKQPGKAAAAGQGDPNGSPPAPASAAIGIDAGAANPGPAAPSVRTVGPPFVAAH